MLWSKVWSPQKDTLFCHQQTHLNLVDGVLYETTDTNEDFLEFY